MASALVVFTPRSGSTIISELLAYKYNAVNFDEIFQGGVRGVLKDKLPPQVKQLISDNNLVEHVNKAMASPDDRELIYSLHKKTLKVVQTAHESHNIVVKYYPGHYPAVDLMEWAIKNNFEIYFINRRNVEEQLYSLFLAECRNRLYKKSEKVSRQMGFINSAEVPKIILPPIIISRAKILELLSRFNLYRMGWHIYEETYGSYGKTIYYEDNVVKNIYDEVGVTSDSYKEYCNTYKSIKPSEPYVVGKDIRNWSEIVEMAKDFCIPNI